ncbi:Sec-independent protein translocase protein TatB [Microbulbifer agarilyticus]|uniref:Sec-independent protein translocase protein TatB n=1 Tax=Microbulbifer agarilyticus TaxID=260552 RepID=UPI001CD5CE7F|nr:Sec-independent protein translocase protein TatB [Microbulbifer agarilyticus]MCA0893381.1 Sec-independent protein translocase protein TatB [Microbulbifer agarilyticus]
MFDIGFFELLLIAVVGLVVIGPERLPDAVRTTVRWWTQIKQTLGSAKEELEREVGADDIRRELHNERVLKELRESQQAMERTFSEAERKFEKDLKSVEAQAQALKEDAAAHAEPAAVEAKEAATESSAPDPAADKLLQAEDYLPEEDKRALAEGNLDDDHLPEEEEELEDPDYPEHLHDHGEPELNPHHPDHFKHEEDAAWAEVDSLDPAEPAPSAEQASPQPHTDSPTEPEDKRQ